MTGREQPVIGIVYRDIVAVDKIGRKNHQVVPPA